MFLLLNIARNHMFIMDIMYVLSMAIITMVMDMVIIMVMGTRTDTVTLTDTDMGTITTDVSAERATMRKKKGKIADTVIIMFIMVY